MLFPIKSLNEKMVSILHDHLIEGIPVSDVAKAHSVSPSYVYTVLQSAPGVKWMIGNVAPGHHQLNLRVVASLNKRLDTQVDNISTADLVKLLIATTPKELTASVYESLREQAEDMANQNGLEGVMRERFIETVMGGMRTA